MVTVDDFLKTTTLCPATNACGTHKRKVRRVYKAQGKCSESTDPPEGSEPGIESSSLIATRGRQRGRPRRKLGHILVTKRQKDGLKGADSCYTGSLAIPLHSDFEGMTGLLTTNISEQKRRKFLPKQWNVTMVKAPGAITPLRFQEKVPRQQPAPRRALEFESLNEHERKLKEWYGKRSV
ncbi:hypothetical protein CPB86DRAFT_787642 [Serendipita vermifera]|nr:hypothetical protein CPB86DRAFT_787642 [Serendipita vermifera]